MKNGDVFILNRLGRPALPADVVLDTDTYNEIDDQYALSYMLLSPDELNVRAVYAAPFKNDKADTPAEGMEKSYKEILRVLRLCGKESLAPRAFRGSASYLRDERTPAESEAARDLIRLALEHAENNPLYVVAIGAITNVASALLLEPSIARKIAVVFLGGNPQGHASPEFNMSQDIAAARVVFGSGVPLVQVPCFGVATHLAVTEPELREHIRGKSPLGSYLYDITRAEAARYVSEPVWSRVIWDVSAVAWLLSEEFVPTRVIPAPIPSYDNGYVTDGGRHPMRVAYYVNRDAVFNDLFRKIAAAK